MMNNNNVKLSICITVFNQYDIVKHHLDNVLKYDKDDVEFLISDDNSSDNIEQLVNSYSDKRVRYIRNNNNLGHDLNIINAIRNCNSEYVYLFRSRDFVLYDKINYILRVLSENKDSSFFMFSCVDENYNDRIIFKKKKYISNKDKLFIHNKLLIHPSGVLYKISDLNINLYEQHYVNHFENSKLGFCIHNLIRIDLLQKGSFYIDNEKCWVYSITENSKDVAVNSSKEGISVYHPDLTLKRFDCELDFISKYVNNKQKLHLLYIDIKLYFSLLFLFKNINSNKKLQRHYNYSEISYNLNEYIRKFKYIVFYKYSIKFSRVFMFILEIYFKYIRKL